MAQLRTFIYKLPCTRRGLRYFPCGEREGLVLRMAFGDDGYGVAEYAPFLSLHHHRIADAIGMIQALKTSYLHEGFFENECSIDEGARFFSRFPRPLSYLLSMAH